MLGDPPAAPKFPIELLPQQLRWWVATQAETMGIPYDVLALPALVCIAGVIGKDAVLKAKRHDLSWTARPCIWGALVMPKGSLKSPAIKAANDPDPRGPGSGPRALARRGPGLGSAPGADQQGRHQAQAGRPQTQRAQDPARRRDDRGHSGRHGRLPGARPWSGTSCRAWSPWWRRSHTPRGRRPFWYQRRQTRPVWPIRASSKNQIPPARPRDGRGRSRRSAPGIF